MNKKKLLSFALCFTLLISCLLFTDEIPSALSADSENYESVEPVTPPESDFTYKINASEDFTNLMITGYSGKETKIIIPETLGGIPVTLISPSVFKGNEKLTYIKLPSSLTYLNPMAFNMCSSLTEIDVAPSNPKYSAMDGVLYCKEKNPESENYGKIITLVIFPAGKGGSFTIPYGVKTVGAYAFDHCFNLTHVDMYNTVTSINNNAFSFCWNMRSIRLSDNLTSLGAQALAHCDALTEINLPSNLATIGDDAVLGTIDSDNNKVYFFIDGISCTKDSYAYDYLVEQALPESIIIKNKRSVTDNDTGIKLVDAYDVLPEDSFIDIVVKPVEISEIQELLPTRYARAYAFDISFVNEQGNYNLNNNVVLNFDSVCDDAIPSATKIYQLINGKAVPVSAAANATFIGAQTAKGGRFVILENEDFSLKGDIDGDGIVTLFDVKAALHASVGTLVLTAEQSVAANADNSADGKITVNDARKILRMAGGIE